MAEFDLIEEQLDTPEIEVHPTFDTRIGDANIPVLEVQLGDCPDFEFPGWKVLETGDEGAFSWQESEQSLSWKGRVFLQARGPFVGQAAELSALRGLMCQESDTLPPGSQTLIRCRWNLDLVNNLYGLGQRSGPLERTGTRGSNWACDSPSGHGRTTDPLYQAHPLLWGVTGEVWWAALLCHSSYSHFDLGVTNPDLIEWQALGDSLKIQIHAAESPKELYKSLGQTLDRPSLPPLWAFGFHQSRWGYKSAQEISEVIKGFRSRDLSLDAVHLDIDYMDSYQSFSFHPERFPHPGKSIQAWREQGVRTVTIIDPGIKSKPAKTYQALEQGLQGDHFIKDKSGKPYEGYCWPDEALFPDFCRAETRAWWSQMCQFYLDLGVSGLWIDMNEPAIFDKPFWTGGAKPVSMPLDTPWGEDQDKLDHVRLRNLYASFMAEATQSAWDERQERPWILTRSGFTGVGSKAWSWMGDNTSWWEHLALSLPQLASMGLVHSGFVGVDIGGFFSHCQGELYSAWIEASVIYPFMRAHSAMGTREQHPWSFGDDVTEVARQALRIRYQLLPYIYSAAYNHCQGGDPMLRPIFFDYPQDKRFRYKEDQVMFGPDMMACPFVVEGQDCRLVEFPEGLWYDFHSGEQIETTELVVRRNPGRVPLFVKAGAVIPTLKGDMKSSEDWNTCDWILKHFPGESDYSSKLYWDQGDGPSTESSSLQLYLKTKGQSLELQFESIAPQWVNAEMTHQRATMAGFVEMKIALNELA